MWAATHLGKFTLGFSDTWNLIHLYLDFCRLFIDDQVLNLNTKKYCDHYIFLYSNHKPILFTCCCLQPVIHPVPPVSLAIPSAWAAQKGSHCIMGNAFPNVQFSITWTATADAEVGQLHPLPQLNVFLLDLVSRLIVCSVHGFALSAFWSLLLVFILFPFKCLGFEYV